MDDQRSGFLIALADLCAGAALAGLPVEVRTRDGADVAGIPTAPRRTVGRDQADETGFARMIMIDDHMVDLEQVVQCTFRDPSA